MTHRGPFQPRTFCDSVTSRDGDSTISLGSQQPWGGVHVPLPPRQRSGWWEAGPRAPTWHLGRISWCWPVSVGTESENQRMVWVGRDLKEHLVPIPLPWAGTSPLYFLLRGGSGTYQDLFLHFWVLGGNRKKEEKFLRKLTEVKRKLTEVLWHRKSLLIGSPICWLQCYLKIIFCLGEVVLHC